MRHYENAPQRLHTTFKGLTPLQHYFAFTKGYISAKVAYYISPRCVYCKKVHKKQQTITSFSQKLHKSSDTKKRRRPTHKQVTLQETQSTGDKEGKNLAVRAQHGSVHENVLLLCAHVIPFPIPSPLVYYTIYYLIDEYEYY